MRIVIFCGITALLCLTACGEFGKPAGNSSVTDADTIVDSAENPSSPPSEERLFPDQIVPAGEPIKLDDLSIAATSDPAKGFPKKKKFLNRIFNLASPQWDKKNNTLIFPVPGLYFYDHEGDQSIFLAFGGDQLTNADLAFSLVATLADGGSSDIEAFRAAPLEILVSLFDEPRNVSWNCGVQGSALRRLLADMRIESRLVQWFGKPRYEGALCDAHQNLEVNLTEYGGWTLYDPHFGFAAIPGFSSLDAMEEFERKGSIGAHVRLFRNEAPWNETPWAFMKDYSWGVGVYDHETFTFHLTPATNQPLTETDIAACIGKTTFEPNRDIFREFAY